MRQLFGVGLSVAVFALVAGCGKKSTTADGGGGGGGQASIEGEWLIVGHEREGKAKTEEELNKKSENERTMKITADKITIGGGASKFGETTEYKTNTSATPYQIDIITKITVGKKDITETTYGIYKVEGDKLYICTARSDKAEDRPKEFKTAPNSKTTLVTLKKK